MKKIWYKNETDFNTLNNTFKNVKTFYILQARLKSVRGRWGGVNNGSTISYKENSAEITHRKY